MQFTFTGNNTFFLEQSFFDLEGVLSVAVTSSTPSEVVFSHTVFMQANVFVTFKGFGFNTTTSGGFTEGVITSIEFNGLDIRQATISDIGWDAASFQSALFDYAETGEVVTLAALFNSSGPITIDASNGLTGFDQELTWNLFLPLLTQPITFIGSRFDDSVAGSANDDVIDTGANTESGDRIVASLGDDLISFDLPSDSQSPGFYLDYDPINDGVDFVINGVTNTGTATGPDFVDTFENVQDALSRYFGIEGTGNADTFDVTLTTGQLYSFIGGRGADTFELTASGGQAILDFDFTEVTSGIDVDLDTGLIIDDGFGFNETFDLEGTLDTLFVIATDEADRVVDGVGDQLVDFFGGDDLFIAGNLGNDSIDGGQGDDTVSFADVARGSAMLTFDGAVTTLTDRTDPENSTSMFSVETIEYAAGADLELAKHDGIGTISAVDLTALTELYIAYLDRAADALGLSFWATAFQKNGLSLRDIADLFFDQPETKALYDGTSDSEFVQALYENVFGRDADQPGFDFWMSYLAAGNTRSNSIVDVLEGARAATGSPADVAFIENKTDIGLYFAVLQGQSNVTAAQNVMDEFDGSQQSIDDALNLADTALASAEASDSELLLPVIGVIASPFDVI